MATAAAAAAATGPGRPSLYNEESPPADKFPGVRWNARFLYRSRIYATYFTLIPRCSHLIHYNYTCVGCTKRDPAASLVALCV